MIKKLLLIFLSAFLVCISGFSQPFGVTNVVADGRFAGCGNPPPTITATLITGNGSHVAGNILVCDDPCDTSIIELSVANLQWQKNMPEATPPQFNEDNWLHGFFFTLGLGISLLPYNPPLANNGFTFSPGCTGACPSPPGGGVAGGAGYYYNGTTTSSCCVAGQSAANPCDNWGDVSKTCSNFTFVFRFRLCNSAIIGINGNILRFRGTSDGATGCWTQTDNDLNQVTFKLNTTGCATLYSPVPVASAPVKTCLPTLNYTSTLTGSCGNGSTITWWTAATGGTQVGSGSPFVYDPPGSTCPGGTTLYAACCPSGSICASRKAFAIPAPCPALLIIDSIYRTVPTCSNASASIDSVYFSNANGVISYNLNPGNITNSTGVFPGLITATLYTVTITDASGCQASANITFAPPTNCCGPAPVPQGPVTYCQNATNAVQLTATGTALLWYTVPIGGVGSTTAPTPSTTTAGTFTFYVTQTVNACESPRVAIVVTITATTTITLSSAPATNNQTVCVGSAITNITYTTANGVTGATVTGLPAGVTGLFNAGVVTISGTPIPTGVFTYAISTTGGCGTASANGTITVSTASILALTSLPATTSQSVCINTAITNIVYTAGGGATGATVTGLPAGVTGLYAGGTVTISGSPTSSGVFSYTVSTTGGCGVATLMGTITVTDNVTLALTSAAATTSQSVCANTAIVNITYSTGSGATGATVTGLPTGVTGTFAGGVFTISGSPTVTGSFPYTVTTSGGCSTASLSGTITVTPGAATLTLSSGPATTSQTVCINTAITAITYVTGGGASGGTVTGLPTGVTGTFNAGTITITGTPSTAGVFSYTVTTSGSGSCGSPTQTGTITVNDNATLTLTSAAATTAQTICITAAIVNITYSTANGVTGATVTGLPAGVTGVFNAGVVTISGTPSPTGPFSYTVTTTGGCSTVSLGGTITINSASTLTLMSAASTTSQTLCINTALTTTTYNTGGGATGATVTGLPTGVTGVYNAGIVTISGTPTVSGPFGYTVTTTGGCGVATLSGTITVNPVMTIVLTSAASTTSQSICANTALTNIVYTVGNGATGATVIGLPVGVNGVYNAGVFTISGSPTGATGTFNYIVTGTGGCGTATLSGSIIVTPGAATLTLSSAPASSNQTVCINNAITDITYTTGGGASGGTVTGLPTGVSGTYSAGVITISGTPTVAGTFNYTVTTTGSGSCGSPTQVGVITVNDNVAISLTSAPATTSQTVCINTAITNIIYTTSNGATGATVTGLPTGVTGTFNAGVFTISNTPTVSGIFNYNVTTVGGCLSASLGGSITVSANATMTLTSAPATSNQTVSINTPITTITYGTANGVTSVIVTGLPPGVTGSFAGGVFTISGTPTGVGTFNYTVTTTGGCGTVTLNGVIVVNDLVNLTLTSAAGTDNQTICISAAILNITYAAGGGATGASITAGTLPTGVTGTYNAGVFIISGTPTQTGTFNYTVTTSGGVGTASLSGTIIIIPNATISLTSAAATIAQTICVNTAITNITYSIGTGGTGAIVTGLPAGVSGSFAGGVFTISGIATASGPFPYTVTTTGGCSTASLSGTITVNPNATIALTSAAGTNAQTVCINTAITAISYTIGSGATGATVTGLPAGVTSTFSGGILICGGSGSAPTVTGTFPYTVTTTGGCSTASLSGTITVNANVTMALTSAAATTSQNLCINTLLTDIVYTTANGATGATVTGLPAGVSGNFSGAVFTISGTPTVSGPFSYTVTTTGGCGTASLSGTITVNPAATLNLTSAAATTSQTVCINTAVTNITYATATGATGASVTGLPAGVTGNFAGGIFTISGTPSVSGPFTYTVTTSGGCGNATISGTITVNANVTLVLTSAVATTNQIVCINGFINNIVYTSANGATGATVTGLPAGVTGSFATGVFTISGSPTGSGTFNYTVTTTGGCSTASQLGSIVVNPNATIALSSAAATTAQTICINTAITNITYTVANGGTGATVTGLPAGVTGSFAGGVFTISGTPTAPIVAGTFPYIVSPTGGCSSANLAGTITVNPNVTIALTSAAGTEAQTVCINNAVTNIVYTTANNATGATVTGLPAGVTGNFSAGVYTISGTVSVTGIFSYTVTTTGGCSTASLSGTITVNANVTMALTSAAATTSQNLCINTLLTDIVYTTANGATGATVTGLPAGVSGNFSGAVFTISGTPTVSGPFSYTVTTTGGCGTASLSGTITVNPAATLNLTSAAATTSQTVCINTAVTNITYATATGATGASVTGLPAGVTGNFAGGIFTISGTPSVSSPFTYTVTTSGGCGTASLSGTITVNDNVTMVLTSAVSTTNQVFCLNTNFSDIVYTAASGATGVTASGLPAGITGVFNTGVFTVSGNATVSGNFPYTVTTTGGCSSVILNGTITVNPIPSAPTTPNANIVYCENAVATQLGATGNNLLWYTTATGGTGSSAAPTPSTSVGGTTSFWVSQSNLGCESPRTIIVVNVTPLPSKPIVKSPVLYCANDVPRALSDSVTGTNLLWYTTPSGGTGSSTSPMPNTSTPGSSTNYYVSQSNGNCEGPRELIVVNVINNLSIIIGPDSTICQGNSVKYYPIVTPSAASFVWRAVGVPNSTIDSINNINATFSPVDAATYFLKATLGGALGGCSAESSVNVSVRWKPIVDAGNNVAICLNNSTVLSGVITHTTPGPTGVPISDFVWTPKDSLSFDSALVVTAYPTKTTWYRLTVKTDSVNYGCAFTSYDSVKVVLQPTVMAFAGKDTIAVKGGQHQLQGSGGTFYEWSSPSATILNPTLKNPFVVLNNDANFYLKVSDPIGCEGFDSVFVKVYNGPQYYMPNAFSPNGDGLNDVFRAIPVGISNTTYFRVFNRYGELMFETNQWLKGWDGTYKGKPQPSGAYVWSVKGTDKDKKVVELQGSVMLVR